jgi:serine/threonine protein kinase
MNCPSCNSSLEPNARFCGVCGYRLQARSPNNSGAPPNASSASAGSRPNAGAVAPVTDRGSQPAVERGSSPVVAKAPQAQAQPQKPKPLIKPPAASRHKQNDDIYINTTLNNRFKVESKIGEGGFGAVYRGVQLATGRKVALKLLHPEMTKDDNLVARFRREGMVLCNLRDAHTITTYDFDQTPDGTLYIAMELLEGKSLHQIFHEEAPLDWKRVFKILTEMCSSLAEAHAQGIVHRDLKPENIYLESRPGNPEFVKILDFGIAKVMRGDSIDPQSPQLTATGQTLGTLEYMSPEQLMGKQLDGRSDVYALGVVAYEMITGKLPFPDAKGPAGLITAQLKTTPPPPSQTNPKANLPQAVDRVILKCLEKNKDNRHADVTALSFALQEVVTNTSAEMQALSASASQASRMGPEMLETRRGDMPNMVPPPAMPQAQMSSPHMPMQHGMASPPPGQMMMQPQSPFAVQSSPQLQPLGASMSGGMQPYGQQPQYPVVQNPQAMMNSGAPMYPQASHAQLQQHGAGKGSVKWIWWVVGLLALGAAAGAVLALVMRN